MTPTPTFHDSLTAFRAAQPITDPATANRLEDTFLNALSHAYFAGWVAGVQGEPVPETEPVS